MSSGPLGFLLVLGPPLVLGAALLRALGVGYRSDRLAYLGWAWVAGTGATAAVVFAWLCAGPDTGSALVPTAGVLAAALALGLAGLRRPLEALVPAGERRFARWERNVFAAAVGLALLVTAERILVGTLQPVVIDDEANFWALKAKVIFHTGGFGDGFRRVMADPIYVYNKDYPNLNPLLQVWTFAHAGRVVHVANRLPIQLFALAQVLVVASALRRVVRPALAALLVVILVAPREALFQTHLAHGDLMVGLGAVLAFDGWLRWRRHGSPAAFRLACLGLAFMLGAKNEGLLFAACIAAAALVGFAARLATRSARPLAPPRRWLLLPLAVAVANKAFNAWFGFQSGFLANPGRDEGMFALLLSQFSERLPAVLGHFAGHVVFDAGHSNLLVAAFLVLLVVFPRGVWKSELRLPGLALLLGFCAVAAVFVGAPHDVRWHLNTAAGRVSFQLYPALVLWLGLACAVLSRPGSAAAPQGAGAPAS